MSKEPDFMKAYKILIIYIAVMVTMSAVLEIAWR